MGHDNGTGTKADAGDVGHHAAGIDGLTDRSDASSRHGNIPGAHNGTDTNADMKEYISMHQDTAKQPNSPIKPERRPVHDQVEPRNQHRHAEHAGRHAWHFRTHEYSWRHAGNHQYRYSRPETTGFTNREHKVMFSHLLDGLESLRTS